MVSVVVAVGAGKDQNAKLHILKIAGSLKEKIAGELE
jgi:hypothetical protein